MNEESKTALSNIMDHKESIKQHVLEIGSLLKEFFPKEYEFAYQHYIPQILTALNEDDRWLPRGSYTIQNTVDNLKDRLYLSKETDKGIKKYIF